MRISKLYMPAVTLAGALALAGCGGGSSTPAGDVDDDDDDNVVTKIQCQDGTEVTAPATCPTVAAESAFAKAGGTPGALLIASGANAGQLNWSSAGAGPRATAFNALKDADKISGLHGSKNPGMKWYEALGAQKDVELTISGATRKTNALKVTGKKLSELQEDSTDPSIPSNPTAGTIVNAEVGYMGIPGRLICNGDNCKQPAENGLIGDWYFIADSETQEWVKDDDEYVHRDTKPHADWGIWLVDQVNEPGKTINWHRSAGVTANLKLDVAANAPAAFNKATYKGAAVGVSTIYKTDDDPATVGSFTATAELTATFHTDPTESTLEGTIKDFDGLAANKDWELTLDETLIESTGALGTAGTGTNRQTSIGPGGQVASAEGSWDAQLYGTGATPNERPVGVVGDFDGRFIDGQAVGVFHAD